jgi:hypothetical protein
MEQLHVGVDTSMIALWLWHKSVATTQTYLHIHLALRETALAKMTLPNSKLVPCRPADDLLRPLDALEGNGDKCRARDAGIWRKSVPKQHHSAFSGTRHSASNAEFGICAMDSRRRHY